MKPVGSSAVRIEGEAAMNQLAIVDTHVHFWDLRNPRENLDWVWLPAGLDHPILGNIDNIKSLRYDIEGVWAEARFAGIEAFVHVQAAIGSKDPVEETRWLEEMRQTAPAPFSIVGHVDLTADAAAEQLDAHQEASEVFVGVRDFAVEPALASGDLDVLAEGLSQLVSRDLLLDMDCEWPNMSNGLALASRFPDLKIVLEHIGFPRSRDNDYFDSWSSSLRQLAAAENITCKVSGLAMTDPRFTQDSLRPWVETCLEAFGPSRIVLGSNWPIDRLYSSYDVIMDFYRDYMSEFPMDDQEKMLSGNARRLYRL